MHELSIALNIVEIATEETQKANAREVTELEIEIGALSGVVIEALQLALEEATKNSVLSEAEINMVPVMATGKCNDCGKEFDMSELYDLCPFCHSTNRTVLKGKELKVKSLSVK